MVADIVRLIPLWVLVGLAVGGVAALAIVLTFVLGDKLFPTKVRSAPGAVDGSHRRRAEIREYLHAIGEPFEETAAVGGVTVDFYLAERDVAITFDAHDYFTLETTGTYTVLVEEELPGRALGDRLPFDVPTVDGGPGFDSGPGTGFGSRYGSDAGPGFGHDTSAPSGGSDPVAAAFAELGVDRTADEAAVKQAYRDRVKAVHPDQGGDPDSFRRVQEAYAVARNYAGDGRDADATPPSSAAAAARASRGGPGAARGR